MQGSFAGRRSSFQGREVAENDLGATVTKPKVADGPANISAMVRATCISAEDLEDGCNLDFGR